MFDDIEEFLCWRWLDLKVEATSHGLRGFLGHLRELNDCSDDLVCGPQRPLGFGFCRDTAIASSCLAIAVNVPEIVETA
jgi:hypothetical protein